MLASQLFLREPDALHRDGLRCFPLVYVLDEALGAAALNVERECDEKVGLVLPGLQRVVHFELAVCPIVELSLQDLPHTLAGSLRNSLVRLRKLTLV